LEIHPRDPIDFFKRRRQISKGLDHKKHDAGPRTSTSPTMRHDGPPSAGNRDIATSALPTRRQTGRAREHDHDDLRSSHFRI
jgi:hypothetical protein